MNATVTVERDTLFRIESMIRVIIQAADKTADLSANGQDVEGEITDVRLALEDVVEKLNKAMG